MPASLHFLMAGTTSSKTLKQNGAGGEDKARDTWGHTLSTVPNKRDFVLKGLRSWDSQQMHKEVRDGELCSLVATSWPLPLQFLSHMVTALLCLFKK